MFRDSPLRCNKDQVRGLFAWGINGKRDTLMSKHGNRSKLTNVLQWFQVTFQAGEPDGSEEGGPQMKDSAGFFVSLFMSLLGDMSKGSSAGSSASRRSWHLSTLEPIRWLQTRQFSPVQTRLSKSDKKLLTYVFVFCAPRMSDPVQSLQKSIVCQME